jgi:hypothetical protein
MANIIDLNILGKKISEEFIVKKADMTRSLAKVASEHGLNKQQVKRVAEVANVEAYVSLMKTADDKYLTFPVADADVVTSSFSKKADIGNISAYNDAPKTDVSASDIFAAYGRMDKTANWSNPIVIDNKTIQIALTKEAEEIIRKNASVSERLSELRNKNLIKEAQEVSPSSAANVMKLANEHQGVISFVQRELSNRSSNALCTADKLYHIVKQACLSGNTYSDVHSVLKFASPIIGEDVSKVILHKLAEEAPHLNYDITDVNEIPNTETVIYKTAQALEEQVLWAARLDSALDKLYVKYANFAHSNDIPNVFKNTIKERFASNFVKTAVDSIKATPILAAFVAGSYFGNRAGKDRGKREQGRVLQEAMLEVGKPKKELY